MNTLLTEPRAHFRWLIPIGIAVAVTAGGAPPEETVRRIEDSMRPDKSFVVETRIDTYRDRSPVGSIILTTCVHVPADGTEPAALSFATAPEADRGKVILRQPDGGLWLLTPGAQRPVKLTNQQSLHGDASLDDLTPLRLSRDYIAADDGGENITDAGGKTVNARRIALVAKTRSAPYPALRLWTDGIFDRLVKVECRTAGGRVLRTVFFGQYRGILGAERPTEWTIVDGVRPGRVTRLRFSGYAHRTLPGELFHPDKMKEAATALASVKKE